MALAQHERGDGKEEERKEGAQEDERAGASGHHPNHYDHRNGQRKSDQEHVEGVPFPRPSKRRFHSLAGTSPFSR